MERRKCAALPPKWGKKKTSRVGNIERRSRGPCARTSRSGERQAVSLSLTTHQSPLAQKNESQMNTKPGIVGKKLGMTQLYKDDGTVMRVTVLDMSAVSVV